MTAFGALFALVTPYNKELMIGVCCVAASTYYTWVTQTISVSKVLSLISELSLTYLCSVLWLGPIRVCRIHPTRRAAERPWL
jgi:hypothetical protein